MSAVQGYKALVKAQSSKTAFTDEAMSTSDNQTYTIVDSGKGIWTLDPLTVKDNAVITTEEYTVQRLANGGATVTFPTVDVGRGPVTVSGFYVTLITIATANSFSFSATRDALDDTPFNSTGARTFKGGLLSATAELSRFYATDDFFIDIILSGDIQVIEYYPQSTLEPFRFFGLLTSESIEASVDGLVNESMSYQVTTEFNFG